MAIPEFQGPGTKQNWDIREQEAGDVGSQDPASIQVTRTNGVIGLEMGVFVVDDGSGKLQKQQSGSTVTNGVSLLSDKADDFENRKFNVDDKVPVARRGFFIVKIDTANAPAVGAAVRISHAAAIEGYITTNGANSKAAAGLFIERVFDNVAEIYLRGDAEIALT